MLYQNTVAEFLQMYELGVQQHIDLTIQYNTQNRVNNTQ